MLTRPVTQRRGAWRSVAPDRGRRCSRGWRRHHGAGPGRRRRRRVGAVLRVVAEADVVAIGDGHVRSAEIGDGPCAAGARDEEHPVRAGGREAARRVGRGLVVDLADRAPRPPPYDEIPTSSPLLCSTAERRGGGGAEADAAADHLPVSRARRPDPRGARPPPGRRAAPPVPALATLDAAPRPTATSGQRRARCDAGDGSLEAHAPRRRRAPRATPATTTAAASAAITIDGGRRKPARDAGRDASGGECARARARRRGRGGR